MHRGPAFAANCFRQGQGTDTVRGGPIQEGYTMARHTVLFQGKDAAGQIGLWETDGSAAGTHGLTGIAGASASGLSSNDMTVFNGEVVFEGIDAAGHDGLWETDGTAAGTDELTGIVGADAGGLTPHNMTALGGE